MKKKYLRIAIDLDDTVFKWQSAHEEKFCCKLSTLSDDEITRQVNTLRLDKEFWSNLDLLERPDFVYEIIATKRINPKAYTHLLVVPKEHAESLNELNDKNILGELLMGVKAVTKQLGIKSYKTIINTGREAGQEVFHLHIHVLSGNIKGV